ncbi:MAG: hypothetical protein VB912_02355, partial [Pirellulaceae bacterium]
LAQVFSIIGDNVADGRAIVEMSTSIRDTANRLQEDLDAITVPARPWPEPGSGLGYLEYLEGNGFDLAPDFPQWDPTSRLQAASIVGDSDDVLAFTVRSKGQPFVGRLNGNTIRSNVAEIIWWLEPSDTNKNGTWDWRPNEGVRETFSLYRRVLLVLPDRTNLPVGQTQQQFYLNNDLSVRQENGGLLANSLADLTKRQNRAGHVPESGVGPNSVDFPYPIIPALGPGNLAANVKSLMPRQGGVFLGEDIILSNVIGFDIKVFDPTVPIALEANNVEAVLPGDPGFNPTLKVQGYGGFVDLGFHRYQPGVTSTFSGRPHVKSKLTQYVYDTWSLDYEFDGINQDGGKLDQGTNGLDDDGINGVDDLNERETSPPYPSPLRGIQIVIRTLDPDSRQVRQITVTSDFTPE